MPQPLSYAISVTVLTTAPPVTQAGFGVPLIVSHNAAWLERTRTYTSNTGVEADFAAATPERMAAAAMFAQSPAPKTIMIGRASLKPTQRWAVNVASVIDSTAYKLRIAANVAGVWTSATVTFTSGVGTTNDLITAGLKAAVDVLGLPLTTSTPGGAGVTTLRIVANVAGAYFAVEPNELTSALSSLLGIVQDHADPGIATDLAAIKLESDEWYGLVTTHNSTALVAAAAAWAESNSKFYAVGLQESAIANVALSGATDEATALKNLSYKRTGVFFHPALDEFPDAAEMGRWFPIAPGGTNFRLKALAGVSVRNYTATQVVNLEAKRCNYYTTFGGNPNVCGQGQMAGGQFMDVTRDIDQMVAWVAQDLASLLSQVEKLPYTEEGADLIEATIRAVNDRGIKAGIVNGGEGGVPAPVVTVPKPAEQSAANRQLRKFVGITDVFRLAGAVNFIEVTLSIST